jgi:hypothetical protein
MRKQEMELSPKIFPWHMSEKAKLLAHFTTKLGKNLSIFTSDRFLTEMRNRIKCTQKFCESDPTKTWWFKEGESIVWRFKIVVQDEESSKSKAEKFLEARPVMKDGKIDLTTKI